jgi:ferredoxin-NADP reductase
MEEIVKIISIRRLTHNVRLIRTERPAGYEFVAGQATEVSINRPEWKEEKRPFTFTGLESEPYLEFVIKSYGDHKGVTNEIDGLRPGDELIIREVWGAINYKGEGYFIAGGAGITPFVAIIRKLNDQAQLKGNRLIFANRTVNDIILKEELERMLGENVAFIVTQEADSGSKPHKIDRAYLQTNVADFSKYFYLCGPDKMVAELSEILVGLGAKPDAVVFEK